MGKLAMATVCPSRSKLSEEIQLAIKKQQLLQLQEQERKRSDDGRTYSAEALSLIEGMLDDISYAVDCLGINCVLEDIRDLPGDFFGMFRLEPSSSSPKGYDESTFVTGP